MTSQWTLELAAEICFERGLTAIQMSIETIRQALKRLGVVWKRAKHWITSPDPAYARKKKRPEPVTQRSMAPTPRGLGFGADVWWVRLPHPTPPSRTAGGAKPHCHDLPPPLHDPPPQA